MRSAEISERLPQTGCHVANVAAKKHFAYIVGSAALLSDLENVSHIRVVSLQSAQM